MAKTHQRISVENQQRIENIGRYGESFNDVVGRLIDYWEEGHIKKQIKV